tara:strand:- start:6683 stop:14947 length:8265 start_codon:yes stop_codon:yes gene_type:complete
MGRYLGEENLVINSLGRNSGLPVNPIDDQFFGQRMQLLHREGGNRFFDQDVEVLTELAMSDVDDGEMLDVYLTGLDQADANKMKESFNALPTQIQRAEFSQLAPETQSFMIGSGYTLPEEKKERSFWDRFTLNPTDYEFFGRKAWNPLGLGVLQGVTGAIGWTIGTTSRVLWETALFPIDKVMLPGVRTINAVAQNVIKGSGRYADPSRWREAWDASYHSDDSYHLDALDEVREKLGDEELHLMRLMMSDGVDAVYEDFISEGLSEEEAREKFYTWYSSLGDESHDQAFTTLGNNVNTEFTMVLDAYNAIRPGGEITPDSLEGKIVGTAGSLATAILLDPFTWATKVFRVFKTTRLQTKPNMGAETIELLRSAHLQTAALADDSKHLLTKDDLGSVLNDPKWAETYKRVLGAEDRGKYWKRTRGAQQAVGNAIARVLMNEKMWPARFVRQFNGFNKLRFRVNDAFRYEMQLESEIVRLRSLGRADPEFAIHLDSLGIVGDEISENVYKQYAQKGIEGSGLDQLIRDYPQQITPIIGHMKVWHSGNRFTIIKNKNEIENVGRDILVKRFVDGEVKIVLNDSAEAIAWGKEKGIALNDAGPNKYSLKKPIVVEDVLDNIVISINGGLETADGYFNFLKDNIGFGNTIGSTASGVDPDLMLIPAALGIGRNGKSIGTTLKAALDNIVDFAAPQKELMDSMAAATGEFLGAQGKYVISAIKSDIDSGAIQVSEKFKEAFKSDESLRVLLERTKKDRTQFLLDEFNLDEADILDDLLEVDEAYTKYESISTSVLKESGRFDEFFNFHEYNKEDLIGNFKAVPRIGAAQYEIVNGKKVQMYDWKPVFSPARMLRRVNHNYIMGRLHPAGSLNNEVQSLASAGLLDNTMGAITALGYYPAKLAQKFLTYMPRQGYLDVMNLDTAAREMQGLLDMGLLTNMPKHVRDEYLRIFINGSEADRWMVQTEFFLDFLGRSGALLNGGTDAQKFVNRFVRHSQARYSMLPNLDAMPVHGITVNRAVTVSKLHQGQMSALNIIPDYRELGSVARYMNFYKKLGWGLHIPTVDRFLARTWRPAVLLRLGYVVRNGGEELASWMFREGPKASVESRLTARVTGYQRVWDEYGMKTFAKISEQPDKVQHGIIWGAVSRVHRSMLEIAGIGDMALTTKAMRSSMRKSDNKWSFLSDTERAQLFEVERKALVAQTENRVISGMARGSLKWAEEWKQKLHKPLQDLIHSKGIPTRQQRSRWLLSRFNENYEQDVRILSKLFANPRVVDEQMKHILGAFDSHLSTKTDSLDTLIRQSGQKLGAAGPDQLIRLTFNHSESELNWVENLGTGNTMYSSDFAAAAATQLSWMGDSVAHSDAARALFHFIGAGLGDNLTVYVDDLKLLLNESVGLGEEVYALLNTPYRAADGVLRNLEEPAEILLKFMQDKKLHSVPEGIWEGAWKMLRDDFYSTANTGRTSGEGRTAQIFWDDAVDDFFGSIKPAYMDKARSLNVDEFRDFLKKQGISAEKNELTGISKIDEIVKQNEAFDIIEKVFRPVLMESDLSSRGWLLNIGADSNNYRVENFTTDWFEAKTQAEAALYRFYNGTPEGQQQLLSAVRSKQGGLRPGTGPIRLAVPPGHTRVFVPFVPKEQVAALSKVLNFENDPQRLQAFMQHLTQSVMKAGYDHRVASKLSILLRSENFDGFKHLAQNWMNDTHVPLMLMTPDAQLASVVSDSLSTWVRRESLGGSSLNDAARIGEMDISSKGLIQSVDDAAVAKGDLDVPRYGDFWGAKWDDATETGGYQRASATEFERGIGRENIWGVGPESVSTGSGISMVPNSGGKPNTFAGHVWRNSETNEFMILREGQAELQGLDTSIWNIEKTMTLSSNDLQNAAKELAFSNAEQMEHLLTNSTKLSSQGEPIETFYPFLEMINGHNKGRTVDAGAVLDIGSGGQWWDKMPSRILGYVPATSDVVGFAKVGEKWQNLLRNWFDGIVNPAIGAMVREPLFHHYYLKAYQQTAEVETFFHHSPAAYRFLRNKDGTLKKTNLRKHIEMVDGQVRIPVFDDFLELEMNLANAEPDSAASVFANMLQSDTINPVDIRTSAKSLLKEIKDATDIDPKFKSLLADLTASSDNVIKDFAHMSNNRKLQLDRHREVAMRRGMHLTTQFIDDHSIRSQFQGMVGTAMPFWFAEDQFIRRVGRSLKHNPLMFRNAALWEKAGVYSGLVQEDRFGSKYVVVPGSGVAIRGALEILSHTPVLKRFFGAELGGYIQGDMAFNINMLPGYNFDVEDEGVLSGEGFIPGDMGFGPMLAIPILWASQVDPSIRQKFENNLQGGRFNDYAMPDPENPDNRFNVTSALRQAVHNISPSFVTRTWNGVQSVANIAGIGGDPASRSKAAYDVMVLRWMQGRLPTEEEIGAEPNSAIFLERLMDEINTEATMLQMLQNMSWFFGPSQGTFTDLIGRNKDWEWNAEFFDLLDTGVPYEDAFKMWTERIIATEGEFNPYQHSPFRISKGYKKIPIAVLEATQNSNVWLTENSNFVVNYPLASTFFMPRSLNEEDDDYSAEAKSRMIAYGLYEEQTPLEFLEQMYYQSSFSVYAEQNSMWKERIYAARAKGADTSQLKYQHSYWKESYLNNHPVLAEALSTGTSEVKRNGTIDQMRNILTDVSSIPDTEHKEDIVATMRLIVDYKNEMDALKHVNSVTPLRNEIKLKYHGLLEEFAVGKSWLNELYWNLFIPLIGDDWIAKLNNGLLEFPERRSGGPLDMTFTGYQGDYAE